MSRMSLTRRLCAGAALGAAAIAVGAAPPAHAAWEAPESALASADATTPACTTPAPTVRYAWLHCYTPQQIRAAYGVDQIPNRGDGQTIVLVVAYGSPTAVQDLQTFHDTFYPNLPNPNFQERFPLGHPNYH